MSFPKTIFCDIDGVIFKHYNSMSSIIDIDPRNDRLPGVVEAFERWNREGHRIILTTGRPESFRNITHQQIIDAGLFYHELIMNLPRGSRVVINDKKTDGSKTTEQYNPPRNEGLQHATV